MKRPPVVTSSPAGATAAMTAREMMSRYTSSARKKSLHSLKYTYCRVGHFLFGRSKYARVSFFVCAFSPLQKEERVEKLCGQTHT